MYTITNYEINDPAICRMAGVSMQEQFRMTHDIVDDHGTRMQNMMKYYPFFVLAQTTFAQYQDGRYSHLDMAYITMAVLRFFIEENNFKERDVKYPDYEDFLRVLLKRDFSLVLAEDEEKELFSYIFDKLRNDGRPFEFRYFDPVDKKRRTIRMRLIDSRLEDGQVLYSITPDAVSFYLDTKEVQDESTISVEQLLLEKLIRSSNFRGGAEVVRRINSEVNKLKYKKNEVLNLLSMDVFEGMQAYESFQKTGIRWFDEEQKLFHKNMELIRKALERAEADGRKGDYDSGYYQSIRELYTLDVELKRAMTRHAELLSECTDLQKKADQIVHKAKLGSLRSSFDFQAALRRCMESDRADLLGALVFPVLKLNARKTFQMRRLDDMLTWREEEREMSEKVGEGKEEAYLYEDEIEEERISHNYGLFLRVLFDELLEKNFLDLEEYIRVLEAKLGNIRKNADFYGFLVLLNLKSRYVIREVLDKPDTFLEEILCGCYKSDESWEKYLKLGFSVIPDAAGEELPLADDMSVTRLTFCCGDADIRDQEVSLDGQP